eukprot:6189581-Pleurochrysis_carterae.AAC.1
MASAMPEYFEPRHANSTELCPPGYQYERASRCVRLRDVERACGSWPTYGSCIDANSQFNILSAGSDDLIAHQALCFPPRMT